MIKNDCACIHIPNASFNCDLRLAKICCKWKDYEQAEAFFKQTRESKNETIAKYRYEFGRFLAEYGLKAYDLAIQQLLEAIKYEPNNASFLTYIAKCYHIKNDHEKAIKMYQKAMDIESGNVDTMFWFGKLMTDNGQYLDNLVFNILFKVIQLTPEDQEEFVEPYYSEDIAEQYDPRHSALECLEGLIRIRSSHIFDKFMEFVTRIMKECENNDQCQKMVEKDAVYQMLGHLEKILRKAKNGKYLPLLMKVSLSINITRRRYWRHINGLY